MKELYMVTLNNPFSLIFFGSASLKEQIQEQKRVLNSVKLDYY
jgi:hypothetical protein